MIAGIREDLKMWVSNIKAGDSDTWWMTVITGLNIYIVYTAINTAN